MTSVASNNPSRSLQNSGNGKGGGYMNQRGTGVWRAGEPFKKGELLLEWG
jgi:hypothetical protein